MSEGGALVSLEHKGPKPWVSWSQIDTKGDMPVVSKLCSVGQCTSLHEKFLEFGR